MAKLRDLCHHVRSKNAGPFWITIDLFFHDREDFDRYSDGASLKASAVAAVFHVDASSVRRFAVPELMVLKFSYPRTDPQGGVVERDMHGGQQYVRLLDVDV